REGDGSEVRPGVRVRGEDETARRPHGEEARTRLRVREEDETARRAHGEGIRTRLRVREEDEGKGRRERSVQTSISTLAPIRDIFEGSADQEPGVADRPAHARTEEAQGGGARGR